MEKMLKCFFYTLALHLMHLFFNNSHFLLRNKTIFDYNSTTLLIHFWKKMVLLVFPSYMYLNGLMWLEMTSPWIWKSVSDLKVSETPFHMQGSKVLTLCTGHFKICEMYRYMNIWRVVPQSHPESVIEYRSRDTASSTPRASSPARMSP